MGLRDIGEKLPPGFRFYPSDEELVCHYLVNKIINEDALKGTLVDIDLHTCEPWQLPDVAKLNASEWYFFSFRDRKYATGYRTNRATTSGYWKATGKDRVILDPKTKEIVGMRKTLVFYKNRAPNGIKTGWIMHEFRLENPHMPPKEDWVLCRVFYKGKTGEINNDDNNKPVNYLLDHTTPSTSSPPPLIASPISSTNHNHYDNNTIQCACQQSNNSLSYDPTLFSQKPIFNNNYNNIIMNNNNDPNNNCLTNLLSLSPNNFLLNHLTKDDDNYYGYMWDMDFEENTNNNNNNKFGDEILNINNNNNNNNNPIEEKQEQDGVFEDVMAQFSYDIQSIAK